MERQTQKVWKKAFKIIKKYSFNKRIRFFLPKTYPEPLTRCAIFSSSRSLFNHPPTFEIHLFPHRTLNYFKYSFLLRCKLLFFLFPLLQFFPNPPLYFFSLRILTLYSTIYNLYRVSIYILSILTLIQMNPGLSPIKSSEQHHNNTR